MQRFLGNSGLGLWFLLILLPALPIRSQERATNNNFHDRAEITHAGGIARTEAFNARPLNETVLALSEEYGWQVDYEDPVYDPSTETVDANDAASRAAHPGATRIMFPSGGSFLAEYSELRGPDGKVNESQILRTIVTAYNRGANPSYFFLENEPGDRIAIVGISKGRAASVVGPKDALLNTSISLSTSQRTLQDTIEAILNAVTEKTGIHAVIGSGPTPQFMQKAVTVGGDNVIARTLLRQSLDQSGRTWLWSMLFEPTFKTYYFNVLPVMVANVDDKGSHHLTSVDPPPSRHPQ